MDPLLLGQSAISGACSGGLYALVGLGLTMSWRYLKVINLSQFALTTLAAYLVYELCGRRGIYPPAAVTVLVLAFGVLGVAQQALMTRFKIDEFASILLTFGVAVIVESLIQWTWSADPLRLESDFAYETLPIGPLLVPVAEAGTLALSIILAVATHLWLHRTTTGKALRASIDDPALAAAFGVRTRGLSFAIAGLGGAFAAIAGSCVALVTSLSPSQVYSSVGVVFAAVLVGGLGRPLGLLGAGILIGELEAGTTALAAPTLAPLVSFSVLILMLTLWPERQP